MLIIQNDRTETLGLYEQYLKEKKVEGELEYDVFHAYAIEPSEYFPFLVKYDAVIIGPTPIPANDYKKHGFLRKEWYVIDEIVRARVPRVAQCLAVCCGAQLAAKYLGAAVKKSPEKEIGTYEVRLTEDGKADPLFAGFPEMFPVFHWHSDMFDVPPHGKLLVEGDPCPIQAFGCGNVRGVLFHLEIGSSEAERWAEAYPDELKAVGKTKEQVVSECAEREPEMGRLAYLLMENFLKILRLDYLLIFLNF